MDTSRGTAQSSDILDKAIAYSNGEQIVGTFGSTQGSATTVLIENNQKINAGEFVARTSSGRIAAVGTSTSPFTNISSTESNRIVLSASAPVKVVQLDSTRAVIIGSLASGTLVSYAVSKSNVLAVNTVSAERQLASIGAIQDAVAPSSTTVFWASITEQFITVGLFGVSGTSITIRGQTNLPDNVYASYTVRVKALSATSAIVAFRTTTPGQIKLVQFALNSTGIVESDSFTLSTSASLEDFDMAVMDTDHIILSAAKNGSYIDSYLICLSGRTISSPVKSSSSQTLFKNIKSLKIDNMTYAYLYLPNSGASSNIYYEKLSYINGEITKIAYGTISGTLSTSFEISGVQKGEYILVRNSGSSQSSGILYISPYNASTHISITAITSINDASKPIVGVAAMSYHANTGNHVFMLARHTTSNGTLALRFDEFVNRGKVIGYATSSSIGAEGIGIISVSAGSSQTGDSSGIGLAADKILYGHTALQNGTKYVGTLIPPSVALMSGVPATRVSNTQVYFNMASRLLDYKTLTVSNFIVQFTAIQKLTTAYALQLSYSYNQSNGQLLVTSSSNLFAAGTNTANIHVIRNNT